MKKKDTFTFGKHKGKTLRTVINNDPIWLEWAVDNVGWLEVSNKVRKRIALLAGIKRRGQVYRDIVWNPTLTSDRPKRSYEENLRRKRKRYAMAAIHSYGFDYTNGS